jgi:peroxiredoxin
MRTRGEILPRFTLPGLHGPAVALESYRGRRNLVVVFAADVVGESAVTPLLRELRWRAEDLTAEAAQVLVIVSSPTIAARRGPTVFPTLLDADGRIHRSVGATDAVGRPAPSVFVTDRFREIFAVYLPARGHGLPSVKEILEWLVFINIQCPECGVPEWAP